VAGVEPFGTAGSGGSTPLRIQVAGEPEAALFGKLYAGASQGTHPHSAMERPPPRRDGGYAPRRGDRRITCAGQPHHRRTEVSTPAAPGRSIARHPATVATRHDPLAT